MPIPGQSLAAPSDDDSHTGPMTASTFTGPRRSGPEIRAALEAHAPSELATFEREFHAALAEAAASFDTSTVDQVLERWWRIAATRSIQLSEDEEDQVRRARAGDYTGLWEQTSDGSFRRIG
jgi:hypothetical protein